MKKWKAMVEHAKIDGSGSLYCVSDVTEMSTSIEVHRVVASLAPHCCAYVCVDYIPEA